MMHDNRGTVVFTGCASCNPWLLNFVTNDSNKTHTVLQKKKKSYQLSMQGHLKTGNIL